MAFRWPAALAAGLMCLAGISARADDCHDRQNDPCDTGQPGICAAGKFKCSGGTLRCQRLHDPVAESCANGLDDDCDGATDGLDPGCRCRDTDGDGFAVCSAGCVLDAGDLCGDCDDSRSTVHPGGVELCNGRDEDCDNATDEGDPQGGAACPTGQPGVCAAGTTRCSSGSLRCQPNRSPTVESCSNGLDDDCDGATDGFDPSCRCRDADGDGFAVCAAGCVLDAGDLCGDCDDSRSSVHPGRAEDCVNGRDDDCDGAIDAQDGSCGSTDLCVDADGDGWAVCSGICHPTPGDRCGDCDDGRAAVNPNGAEVCNGRDDDCDGSSDEADPGAGSACQTGELGICAAGTLRCASGSLGCERTLAPRDEDCDNGLDDDCDGPADLADVSCAPDCGPATDVDGDHLADCADNCPHVANSGQGDYDGDGMGDACETGVRLCDINHSGRVDGFDLALLGRIFGRSCGDSGFDRAADLTRDCRVDGDDLAILASLFGRS